MSNPWLKTLNATQWIGIAELWLDPAGNEVIHSECSMNIESNMISYEWIYKHEVQKGRFDLLDGLVMWVDSWHQPVAVKCLHVQQSMSLFSIEHTYSAPSEPSWNWRSQLSQRPDGSLILQMTNIAPWGEEGRAVRMIFNKKITNI